MADDTGNLALADLFVRECMFRAATPADVRRAAPLTDLRTLDDRPGGIGDIIALEVTAAVGMLLEERDYPRRKIAPDGDFEAGFSLADELPRGHFARGRR